MIDRILSLMGDEKFQREVDDVLGTLAWVFCLLVLLIFIEGLV